MSSGGKFWLQIAGVTLMAWTLCDVAGEACAVVFGVIGGVLIGALTSWNRDWPDDDDYDDDEGE